MGDLWNQFVELFASAIEGIADFVAFAGGHRWALAIVLLTIGVRTVLIPVGVKQFKSMRAMQGLQPEIKRLQKKYKNDKERLNKEMMELYQREGVNPLGGCLPMLPQMPVLLGMFYAIRNLTDVPKHVMEAGMQWVASVEGQGVDVAKAAFARARESGVFGSPPEVEGARSTFERLRELCPDPSSLEGLSDAAIARTCDIIPNMPFLGLGDLGDPSISTVAGILLIVIMTGAQFITTRQMQASRDGGSQQKIMQYMPLFFVVIFINFPAGLVLYWTTSTLFQLGQQLLILRTQELPEPPKAGKAGKAGKSNGKKPDKKGDGKGSKPGSAKGSKKGKSKGKKKNKKKR